MRLVNSELLPQQNSHVTGGDSGGGGGHEAVKGADATQNNLSDGAEGGTGEGEERKELPDKESDKENFLQQQHLENVGESSKVEGNMNITHADGESGRTCGGADIDGVEQGEGVRVEDPDKVTDKSEDDDKTVPLESTFPSSLSLEMVEKGMTTEEVAEDVSSTGNDKEGDESEAAESGGITTVDFVAILWILAMVGLMGSLIYFLVRLAIHS